MRYYEAQGSSLSPAQQAGQPGDDGPAAGHHRLPEPLQRAVPLPLRRRARRRPVGQLRGGDADDDHLRRRAHRPRHLQPREHAPVVGRQRLRGELRPDLLQGGHGHTRRVPVPRARGAGRGRRAGTPPPAGRRSSAAWPGSSTATTPATGSIWAFAPSDPTPARLFSGSTTYTRPGTAYVALRQILGHGRFDRALRRIQRDYGGRSITEPQLEAEFARFLPGHATACQQRLGHFFTQWFDTAFPSGGHAGPGSPVPAWPAPASTAVHAADGPQGGGLGPVRTRGSVPSHRYPAHLTGPPPACSQRASGFADV